MLTATAVDRLFAQWAHRDSPGAVVGVTRHGELIHEGFYGMGSIAHGVPLDRGSVIRIGSQSKQFTVLLALLLEAEGKLSMEDEVHRYCPWLPALPHKVTLRHMATNTSGLRDHLEILSWSGLGLAAPSNRALVRRLLGRHAEMNYVPGSAMLYSNSGFFLLSDIIEEVSGRSFNELLAHYITGRVGMPGTCLMPRDSQILPHLADMHLKGAEGWETVRWGVPIGGEGGMVSTLPDMLAWQATLAHPPADWAPLLARMVAPVHFANGAESTYRMGLVVDRYRGALGIGHGGGVAGGKSESIRFPEHGLGVVITGNLSEMAPFSLARRIADAELAGELAPRFGPEGAAAMCARTGLWRQQGGGEAFVLTADEGRPIFRSLGSTSSGAAVMDEVSAGVFAPERPVQQLTLTPGKDDTIEGVFCGARQTYVRARAPSSPPRDLSGAWVNRGLGIDGRIEGGKLVIRSDVGGMTVDLAWADSDLLLVHPAGASGAEAPILATMRVTDAGLVLTSDRTKGLVLSAA